MYKILINTFILCSFLFFSCKDEEDDPGRLSPINASPTESVIGVEGGTVLVQTENTGWWLEGVQEITGDDRRPFWKNGYEVINGINTPYPTMEGDWYTIGKNEEDCIQFEIEPNTTGETRAVELTITGIAMTYEYITVTQEAN